MSEPMIVAHRGANVDLPEQSLAAYVKAIQLGADAIECDVRLTRDGHLVCHHDRTINRTSNGTGAISDLTLAELQKLNFAGKHHDGAEQHQIVTFRQVLELVDEAPRPVRILVETKHPSRYGAKVEREVHKALAGFPDVQVTVMSFARAAVSRYRALDDAMPLVWLYEYPLGTVPDAARIIGPRLKYVKSKPGLVERARDAGLDVFVWTVNTPEDVEFVAKTGAAAIITDDPAMALATLGRPVNTERDLG
ncbi:glycerophosphodiester phosphodiesterase [Stackebrandtia endophytica]|nr:glycerophosphodiester phosphodiesterase family protein [Stackebrandtia endophytica]